MHEAIINSRDLIILLTEDYLQSPYTRIKGVGIGTKLTKMLSGSAPGQFVLTTALLATDDADPLQVPHCGGIGVSHILRIDRKREQHLL